METSDRNAVRPGAGTPKRALAGLLSAVRRLVGGDRFANLYAALVAEITAIDALKSAPIRLLDYGCGVMSFSAALARDGIIADFVGMDRFAPPAENADPIWQHYRQLPPTGIATVTERFDLTIIIDVLHHADAAERATILRHLASISRFVLVKDHFEHGFCSRQLLRLADWFGNYAYGVNVPDRYFDIAQWEALVKEAGLTEIRRVDAVRVHNGLFGLLMPPRYHFMALVSPATA